MLLQRIKQQSIKILPYLIITILCLVAFFKLFYPEMQIIVTPDFGRNDSLHLSIAQKYLLWQRLHEFALPLWSKLIGTGYPLLGEGQVGMFFIPNLVLFQLNNFPLAYNLALLWCFLCFGYGLYVWLRLLFKDGQVALYGSLITTFSALTLTHLTHITLLQSFSLLPWILWVTHRLTIQPQRHFIAIWALLTSQQLLAGFPQATFITLIFAALYFFWRLKFKFSAKPFLSILAGILLCMGLAAVQILPSQEFLAQTTDSSGFPLSVAYSFSYPLKHLLTFADPYVLGNPKNGTYPPFSTFKGSIFWENSGFFGVISLGLSLVGVFLAIFNKKYKSGRLFLISGGTALLLMLGSHSPLYLLYAFWPFNLFRVPSRFIWMFSISLIILSAYGLLYIRSRIPFRLRPLVVTAAIIMGVIQLWFVWNDYHAFGAASTWLKPPEIVQKIDASAGYVYSYGIEKAQYEIFTHTGWQSLSPYLSLQNSLYPNSNIFWDIPTFASTAGRELRRHALTQILLDNALSNAEKTPEDRDTRDKLLALFGIKYVITAAPLSLSQEFSVVSRIESHGITLYVYQIKDPVPFVYSPSTLEEVQTFEEAVIAIKNPSFVPGESAIIERNIAASRQMTVPVVAQHTDEEIVLQLSPTESISSLVVNQTYYPGWTARADGKPIPIYPANIRQQLLVVPANTREVTLMYRPTSFYRGLAISGVSVLFTCIFLIYPAFVSLLPKLSFKGHKRES